MQKLLRIFDFVFLLKILPPRLKTGARIKKIRKKIEKNQECLDGNGGEGLRGLGDQESSTMDMTALIMM